MQRSLSTESSAPLRSLRFKLGDQSAQIVAFSEKSPRIGDELTQNLWRSGTNRLSTSGTGIDVAGCFRSIDAYEHG